MCDRLSRWPVRGRLTLLVGALALGACAQDAAAPGGALGAPGATAAAQRPASGEVSARDVEAPEVFKRDEAGLWDGRPSLGGVWIAHPDVRDPERVLIRNASNGQYVIGALFRRERENPGPRFQVSSDAAAALGLLAGAPTELQVVALRRAEAAPAADAAPDAPVAGAADADAAATDSAATGAAAARAEGAGAAERPGGLFGLFRGRAAEDAVTGADAGPAAASQTAAAAVPAERAPASPAAAAVSDPASGAGPAETPPPEAAPERRGLMALFAPRRTAAPLSALSVDPGASAAPVSAAAASAQAGPGTVHVQIGIFSVEANARATARDMRRAGLVPVVHEERSSGKTFWRVVVGPATTEADRGATLARVREMGFADAYVVSR